MELKKGYKQTEVGVIPDDWEVEELEDLGVWKGGGTPSKKNSGFWNGDIPWVSPKDFKSSLIFEAEDYITKDAVENSSTTLIPKDSVLIVMRSGILRNRVPIARNIDTVSINQDLKALMPDSKNNSNFIFHLIQSCQDRIRRSTVKVGTTVESIEVQ